jgi:hypothetical protein
LISPNFGDHFQRLFFVEDQREREGKGRAVPLATLHRYLPAVGGDNLLDNVEAQAGPAGFRRIQRLKNLCEGGDGDSTPRILHLEMDGGSRALALEGQCPALGHGVERVSAPG